MTNSSSQTTAHRSDTEVGTPFAPPQEPDTPEAQPARPKLLDLTLTQVLAGSLAAATAAFLGSRLGVAGTIVGAALASVISATTASLYSASLHRARDAMAATRALAATKSTAGRSGRATGSVGPRVVPPTSDIPVVRRLRWRGVLATASVLFAVAVAFLAGVQLTTGQPVTGSDLGTRVASSGANGTNGSSTKGNPGGSGGQVPAPNNPRGSTGLPTPTGTPSLPGAVTTPATTPTTDAGSPSPAGSVPSTQPAAPSGQASATAPAQNPGPTASPSP